MNLSRIQTFMYVVKYKSFSKVAERLDISQPAVSKQIKALEKELGVSLLYRETFEPTEAGRIVINKGEKLIREWNMLVESCEAFRGEMTGLLSIGASTIPGTYLIPTILRKFLDRYPLIDLRLSIYESDEVLEHLRNGKIDIGFVGCRPSEKEFVSEIVAKDRLLIIAPPGTSNVEDSSALKEVPFIFRSEKSGTWQAAKKGLQALGYSIDELKCMAKVQSTESVITMVEQGLGYSIVSDYAARMATKHGRVKVVMSLPTERYFYAVYLQSKENHPVIKALLNDAIKTYDFKPD